MRVVVSRLSTLIRSSGYNHLSAVFESEIACGFNSHSLLGEGGQHGARGCGNAQANYLGHIVVSCGVCDMDKRNQTGGMSVGCIRQASV
jgi:hypothetical protein